MAHELGEGHVAPVGILVESSCSQRGAVYR
jgi:hypothetical protein